MELISTIAGSYAADKLTDLAESLIKKNVIERWTRKRAIEFYRTFCGEVLSTGLSGKNLHERLNELLENEARSEIVFEAYRAVCLSKSKTYGPRIIAIVVAAIVQGDGIASDQDELILAAAETLSDSEFEQFRQELEKVDHLQPPRELMAERKIDSNFSDTSIEITRSPLAHTHGVWAEKLKALGLISESMKERSYNYQAESEGYVDMDGSVRVISWWIQYEEPCHRLAELIDRVRTPSTA